MDIEQFIYQDDWKPTTDLEVSQLMKLLSEKRREAERILKNVKEEIELLENIGKQEEDKLKKLEEKINELCEYYILNELDEDERKETKTQYKYKLARGEIIVKKPSISIQKPKQEDVLIEKYPEFVKEEPKFQWGDFKKNLEINEKGEVVNKKTGEIVEGVIVIEKPKSVSIKTV